jgi:hypothetical protein
LKSLRSFNMDIGISGDNHMPRCHMGHTRQSVITSRKHNHWNHSIELLLGALNSLSTTCTTAHLVPAFTSAPIHPAVPARSPWVRAGVQYQAWRYRHKGASNSARLGEGSYVNYVGRPRGGCNKGFDMFATASLAYSLGIMMLRDRG